MTDRLPVLKRRDFFYACGAAGLSAAAAPYPSKGDRMRPNLVFVFADQMRMHALGFWNTPGFEQRGLTDPVFTPQLDVFARQSLVLSHAVSSHPVCSPYRASLMTGQYSFANRVHWNCTSARAEAGCELPEGSRCWSDVLHDRGYSLGYIGKWHLDAPHKPYVDCYNNKGRLAWNEWCPPKRRHGFDFWYSYGTYDHHLRPMYWPTDAPRDGFVFVDQWGPEHEADQAIRYLRNEGGGYRDARHPFALVVSMNPPHTPYNQVPGKYVEHYAGKTWQDLLNRPNVPKDANSRVVADARRQIKNYLAMVTGVDEQFGRILACLKETGLADNTVVVFASDHGNCIGSHNHATKNNPFDESLRVPFLVRAPGRIKPRVDDLLFGAADVMPTLLGLLGCETDIPAAVEGTNYAPLFLGQGMPRPSGALYLKPASPDPAYGERGVRTHRYTLVINKRPEHGRTVTLYDNQSDPYQLQNIAEEQSGLAAKLEREELTPLLQQIRDPWLNV